MFCLKLNLRDQKVPMPSKFWNLRFEHPNTYFIFHDKMSQKKNTGGKTQSRLPEYFLDAFGWRTQDVEKLC